MTRCVRAPASEHVAISTLPAPGPENSRLRVSRAAERWPREIYLEGLHTKALGQVREVPQLDGEVGGAGC
jgi:hypothetical protein